MIEAIKFLGDGEWESALASAQRSLGMLGEATVGQILTSITGDERFSNQLSARRDANRADTAATREERATGTGRGGRGARGRGARGGGGGAAEDLSPTGSFTEFFGELDERNLSDATERDRGRDEETQKFLDEQAAHAEAMIEYQDELNRRQEEGIALQQKELEIEQSISKETQRQIGQAIELGKTLLTAVGAPKGVLELIEGFSQAAQVPGSYPDGFGMAQHAISAGLHFANAARIGVGGGGAVPSPSVSAGGPARALPVAGPSRGGGGGPNVYNFNAPFSESDLGVLYREADRAAANRYDS